ncbi:MAG: GNAT family N-acetyltransferase [Candidatus Nanoarchaeia archaeon]
MNQVTITKAKPGDIKDITKVLYLTWLVTYPNRKYRITASDIKYKFKIRFTKEELEKRASKIRNQTKNEIVLVAKYNDKIVAVCGANKSPKINELKILYVLPKFQRKGIGQMFWKKLLKFFNKNSKTIVKVTVYNENAIRFYKKLGFIETQKIIIDKKLKMRNGAIKPNMVMVLKNREELK